MANISSYELIDHGIEHSQYFQGCGTAFTSFEHVVTGIGNNAAEAIDDCLEQIAGMCHCRDIVALEANMLHDEGLSQWPTSPSVSESQHDTADPEDSCELYYHVSIRYNVA